MSACKIASPRPPVEADVLEAVKKYLDQQGIRWRRLHCGTVKRGKYWMTLCPTGTPDIVLSIPAGRIAVNPWTRVREKGVLFARIAWIETKEPHQGSLSTEQRQFQREAQAGGELYWVVRSMADLRYYLPPVGELDFGGQR